MLGQYFPSTIYFYLKYTHLKSRMMYYRGEGMHNSESRIILSVILLILGIALALQFKNFNAGQNR